MLVANAVAGDSRVQKIAWAMAGAGWEVTLLGKARGDRREEYRLGAARVLLVPVGDAVAGYERARLRGRRVTPEREAAYRAARARITEWDAFDQPVVGRPPAPSTCPETARGPLLGAAVAGCRAVSGLVDPNGGWRQFNPWFRDLELAFAPVIEELKPDLIHAHDYHMVGIGARAAARLGARWVYDAHEYLAGIEVPGRADVRARLRRRMLLGVEREYIGRADAVVTVSQGIADRLRADHRLRRPPHVLLNVPVRADGPAPRDVRARLGLDPGVPLLLYSGGLAPRRGLAAVVDGLAELPGVHLVLVAREDDRDAPGLLARAAVRGVAERVHTAPYVSPDQVVPYIAGATAGLVPILHRPNHELSLITKYFEYLHAGLPILCSDVREMAAATERLGVGEVFRAGDAASFAGAARRLLADPGAYRARYAAAGPVREWTWDAQAQGLSALYAELLGRRPEPLPRERAGDLRLIPA
jgi:glycosyltransferase involved in cell wall biosynthesis